MREVVDLNEVANDMDEMLAPVMPNSWEGHARMTIHQADLSPKQREFAERLVTRHIEKNTTTDAERLGRLAAEKAREKV